MEEILVILGVALLGACIILPWYLIGNFIVRTISAAWHHGKREHRPRGQQEGE